MQKITPCLWFNFNAEEAVNFYLSVFPDSKILDRTYYTKNSPAPEGTLLTLDFELLGQRYVALNGGPQFPFTNAVSFMVACDTQKEIDYYWNRLLEGGQSQQCSWLTDRYGLAWQIYWPGLIDMLRDPDRQKADRAMQAMMGMVKIDIEELKRAYSAI